MIETKHMKHPKPSEKKTRRRVGKHSRRNKRRTKRGMVVDLDAVATREIRDERDGKICQRCGKAEGDVHLTRRGVFHRVAIQWAHIHSREYHITRWEPDNTLALCDVCHMWLDNHKVLGFDWFAKKFPERWERINRLLQAKLLTDGNCQMKDADVKALWMERVGQ